MRTPIVSQRNLLRKKCVTTIQVVVDPVFLPNSYRGTRMIALFSNRAYRPYFRLRVGLLLLTATLLSVCAARAQTPEPQTATSPARIARDMELIRTAEQEHRPEADRGALW